MAGVAEEREGRRRPNMKATSEVEEGEVDRDRRHSGERRSLCRTSVFGMLGQRRGNTR